MSFTISPNMGLVIPGIGTEYSPTWAQDLNASLSSVDSHNHSSGQGVQIQPNGLDINSDLTFQNNDAIALRSVRFQPQVAVLSGALDVGCLYVVGNELYYNDVTGGHNVQLTASGAVNATSSGISSGTASAAFSAGVLVVKSSASSGANVLMQSAVLTNSGNLTNQLTLQAPTLSGSITETLPSIPTAASFMQMDTSGNMSASIPVSGGLVFSNLNASLQTIITPIPPTTQQFTSGSGTYTLPTSAKGSPIYIRVRMMGGGGGGGGNGGTGAFGGGGGTTTFGSSLLTATGGAPGTTNNGPFAGGAGGGFSVASPAIDVGSRGGSPGQGGSIPAGYVMGGMGGGGQLAIAGAGGGVIGSSAGISGLYGGGGGGCGSFSSGGITGSGGGSGGYVEAYIYSPSATYSYSIGGGGAGGSGSNFSGGTGGNGVIIVEEFYQ